MIKYILILFSLLLTSCKTENTHQGQIDRVMTTDLIPEPDIDIRLEYQKMVADSTLLKKGKPVRYISIDSIQKPKKIKSEDTESEDHETQFSIYSDSNNIIRAITETPFSQSGDWFMEVTHYFDEEGEIFAFQKKLNTFHHSGSCEGNEPLNITEIKYFSKKSLVKSITTLKNLKGEVFKEKDCSYYNIDMPIYLNLKEWAVYSRISL